MPLKFKLKLRKSTLKKMDAKPRSKPRKLNLNPREPRKQSLLNKSPQKIPTKSTSKTLRNCWTLPKKRRLFFNNKKN